ncbi:MAG: zinc-ribbon domain-containing protein [Oscillospiraceae bacterium]|nr:zinc-ribbon domain-containing protein [Oscillospiraceae bacterium]
MFCTNCGKQLPDGARFCHECGTPQAVQQPAQQPTQQAPQQPIQHPAQQPVYQPPVQQPVVRPAAPVIPAPTPGQAAVVSSNAAVVTSNTGVVASNAGVVASNTAVAASNAGVMASNAAVAATNTAVVAATGLSTIAKVLIGLLITAVILGCCAFFIPLNDYGDTFTDFLFGNAYWDEDENGIYHCLDNFETSFNERELSAMLDSFPPAISAEYKLALGMMDFIGGQFGLDGIFTEEMMGAAFGMVLDSSYIDFEIIEFDFNPVRNECSVLLRMEMDGEVAEDYINMVKIGSKWYISGEYFEGGDIF